MPKLSRRRSITLSAVLSTSLIPALGLTAPAAHAVNAGPADSTLTISDGSSTVLIDGRAVTFPTGVTDATWAPNGSRLAFVDTAGNLVSALPDGTGVRVLAHGGPGIVISSPTWSSDASGVTFAESVKGMTGPLKTAKADGYGTSATGGGDGTVISDVPHTDDYAAYTAPDAVYIPDGTSPSRNLVPNYVYQRTDIGSSSPEIWSVRNYARLAQPYKIANGTQPTVSADGKTVAFITADGQLAVVDISNPFKPGAPKVLTTLNGETVSHPTFSPDGTKIAFETSTVQSGGAAAKPKDVETIAPGGGAPTVVSQHPGVPAYRPSAVTHVTRLAGTDRIGTAIAISKAQFPNPDSPTGRPVNLILARSDQYADALAGSVLAKNAPLLLTPSNALDAAVQAEIVRVLGPAHSGHPIVTLLGGTQALSPTVEKAITDMGYGVTRLGGADRFATAVDIAQAAVTQNPGIRHFVVATGENFADALSASATGDPIVLTDDKAMPAATAAFLKTAAAPTDAGPATVYAVGGQAKAATATLWPTGTPHAPKIVPLAGTDRFETSFLVAREFFGTTNSTDLYLGVATAYNWPDSLAGGAAMSNLPGPMLLVDPKTGLTPQEKQWVSANSGTVDSALAFGGPQALSPTIDAQLGTTLSGPAGYVPSTNPPSIPQ